MKCGTRAATLTKATIQRDSICRCGYVPMRCVTVGEVVEVDFARKATAFCTCGGCGRKYLIGIVWVKATKLPNGGWLPFEVFRTAPTITAFPA